MWLLRNLVYNRDSPLILTQLILISIVSNRFTTAIAIRELDIAIDTMPKAKELELNLECECDECLLEALVKYIEKVDKTCKRKTPMEKLLPNLKLPKAPVTSYTLFCKDLSKREKAAKASGDKNELKLTFENFPTKASELWKSLPKSQKKYYKVCAAKDQARFNKQMSVYKAHEKALKKPPSPYSLFSKGLWEQHRADNPNESNISFVSMSRFASKIWKKLPSSEKYRYQEMARVRMFRYRVEMDRVMAGGALDIYWKDEFASQDIRPRFKITQPEGAIGLEFEQDEVYPQCEFCDIPHPPDAQVEKGKVKSRRRRRLRNARKKKESGTETNKVNEGLEESPIPIPVSQSSMRERRQLERQLKRIKIAF